MYNLFMTKQDGSKHAVVRCIQHSGHQSAVTTITRILYTRKPEAPLRIYNFSINNNDGLKESISQTHGVFPTWILIANFMFEIEKNETGLRIIVRTRQ